MGQETRFDPDFNIIRNVIDSRIRQWNKKQTQTQIEIMVEHDQNIFYIFFFVYVCCVCLICNFVWKWIGSCVHACNCALENLLFCVHSIRCYVCTPFSTVLQHIYILFSIYVMYVCIVAVLHFPKLFHFMKIVSIPITWLYRRQF